MNSYLQEHLLPGESVIYETRLHWAMFIGPAIIGVFLLFFSFASPGLLLVLILYVLVVGGLLYMKRNSSEFGITNKRIIMKTGVIRRRSLEILLQKIEGVTVNQDIGGRMFGYGTIVISGTGGTKEPFPQIENPFEFRKRVHEQIGQ
jgi:uncharacterized membrane protein YdbT with pleckstrin-like domain